MGPPRPMSPSESQRRGEIREIADFLKSLTGLISALPGPSGVTVLWLYGRGPEGLAPAASFWIIVLSLGSLLFVCYMCRGLAIAVIRWLVIGCFLLALMVAGVLAWFWDYVPRTNLPDTQPRLVAHILGSGFGVVFAFITAGFAFVRLGSIEDRSNSVAVR